MLPNPSLSFDIQSCVRLFRLPWTLDRLCTQPASRYFEEAAGTAYREWVNEALRDLPHVKRLDLADILCEDTLCYGSKNGEILYRDSGHLSVKGSEYVAPSLHKLIIEALRHKS